MDEHPNVTLVREAHERAERDGPQVMAEYLAPDIIWHEIGRAEPRRGIAELVAAMGDSDSEVTWVAHDVVGNDDHVVVLVDATGKRAGKTLGYRVAEVYHVKDGKITERWAFADDTAAIIDFFA